LQGTVHHIAASGSDQTTTIQNTINSAASGDTIYFDSGTHVMNGSITLVSNLLYIGPTVTFNGQARAVLQSPDRGTFPGTANWTITSGSNITIYGLQFNAGQFFIDGCTNFNMTNCIIDIQRGVDGADVMDFGGVSHAVIQWNTFKNAAGINNTGAGGSCDNLTWTRNRHLSCREPITLTPDANSASNVNNVFTFNYCLDTTRCAIEIQSDVGGLAFMHGWKINDNYIDGINAVSSDFKQGISVVSCNGAEIARNYISLNDTTTSNFGGIEFNCTPSGNGSVHDNYIDGHNTPNTFGIYGGYTTSDQTLINNNNVMRCATQWYSAGGGGVFTNFTSVDRGKPPIFACGAGV
jgi:hypothetical protein